jgi:hypothetical protein
VDNATLHSNNLHNSCQKPLVNRASLSLTIFAGIPNLQTQCSQNNYAQSTADIVEWQGINLHNREKRSMILKIASYPRVLTGKWVIKSIVTCSNGVVGFSTGCRRPVGLYVECLFDWQTEHSLINYFTLYEIPFQKKRAETTFTNFLNPKCPPKALLCKSDKTT